jgi:hypothetical protein
MQDMLKPVINFQYKFEKCDNEFMLYSHFDHSTIPLDETAYIVYCMCGRNRSIGEIIHLLERAYPDEKESIRFDVTAAVNRLIDHNALLVS